MKNKRSNLGLMVLTVAFGAITAFNVLANSTNDSKENVSDLTTEFSFAGSGGTKALAQKKDGSFCCASGTSSCGAADCA